MIKKIYTFLMNILYIIRFSPHVLLLLLSKNNILCEDAKYWIKCYGLTWQGIMSIYYLLGQFKEFRSVFYFRLPLAKCFKIFAPGQDSLFINCDKTEVGGGLFIQHGFSTIINAKSIGKYCWINQQVTIGWTADGPPTIGNNVRIGDGAIVIGNITIGDKRIHHILPLHQLQFLYH